MSYAVFEGYLASIKPIGSGYSFSIKEPTFNNLQVPVYHNLAVWGKVAQAMGPKMQPGARFELKCDITYKISKGVKYTNFTVKEWKFIPKPARKPKIQRPERDDDYFVPTINHQTNYEDRRYEGFESGLR